MTTSTAPKVGDLWYRAKDAYYSGWDSHSETSYLIGPNIELITYQVDKVTPKGVWLRRCFGTGTVQPMGGLIQSSDRKFVLLMANKRLAQPSKEEALKSLIARKARQIYILDGQATRARKASMLAQEQLQKLLGTEGQTANANDLSFA